MKNTTLLLCIAMLLVMQTIRLDAQFSGFKPGIVVSPLRCGAQVIDKGNSPVSGISRANEAVHWGYKAYLFVQKDVSAKLSFRLGLGYARTAYATKKKELVVFVPDPLIPRYTQAIYQQQSATIPVQLLFRPAKTLRRFFLMGGIEPFFASKERTILKKWDNEGKVSRTVSAASTVDFWKFNANLNLGFGYTWYMAKQHSLFVQPVFDINIFPVAKNVTVNRRIYAFGLQLGYRFEIVPKR